MIYAGIVGGVGFGLGVDSLLACVGSSAWMRSRRLGFVPLVSAGMALILVSCVLGLCRVPLRGT